MTLVMHYPLVRFVADGLRDTINSYRANQLPLSRLSWELHTRIEELAQFAGRRSLAQLRSWQRYVEALDTVLRETGREGLTVHEEHTLEGALGALRTTLDELDPPEWPSPHAASESATPASRDVRLASVHPIRKEVTAAS